LKSQTAYTNSGKQPGMAAAIVDEAGKLRAVEIAGTSRGKWDVLWLKSSGEGRQDWQGFAGDCGLSASGGVGAAGKDGRELMIGFGSENLVFYQLLVPAAKEKDMAQMLRLQVESRLPAGMAQMRIAWRVVKARDDGQVQVSVAVGRAKQLEQFAERVRLLHPAGIVLDAEGVVEVWKRFFEGGEHREGIVVDFGERASKVCRVSGGRFVGASSLDLGWEQFGGVGQGKNKSEIFERFARDIIGVIELFGFSEAESPPVFIVSDGSKIIRELGSYIKSAGLDSQVSVVGDDSLSTGGGLDAKRIYEYRRALGVALVGLREGGEVFDCFEGLYRRVGQKQKVSYLDSLKFTGTAAGLMLCLLLLVFYLGDVIGLRMVTERLARLHNQAGGSVLLRQKLVEFVESQRAEVLVLLAEISSTDADGIKLSSLEFIKGRPVTITGEVKKAEQLDEFEKKLQDRAPVTGVRRENVSEDKEKKKLEFTITFHYGLFTRKGS